MTAPHRGARPPGEWVARMRAELADAERRAELEREARKAGRHTGPPEVPISPATREWFDGLRELARGRVGEGVPM